jgi:FKBP-type peptidyl-prolyl cis-trans isomerase SlyD
MNISKNMMVSLTYDLRYDDINGELIEQATAERPLSFVFGAGQMLPKFESQLEGLPQGSAFEISLDCVDAYGELDEDALLIFRSTCFLSTANSTKKLWL